MPFPPEARILMVAYHCDPDATGEPRQGWLWAEAAASTYSVTLLTRSAGRPGIERHRASLDLTPVYLDPPPLATPGTWLHQLQWERAAWKIVQQLHAEEPFQLVHQITPRMFRFPGSQLPIPSVWGPIQGGATVPRGYGHYLGPYRLGEAVNRLFHRPSLSFSYPSLERTSILWVANRTTLQWLPSRFRQKAVVVPPEVAKANVPDLFDPLTGQPLSLLYVGNGNPTHAIPLVFAALKGARLHPGWTFHIVGEGPALAYWQTEARRLGISRHVRFPGRLPAIELELYISQSHALVLPALCDSSAAEMLEGMSRGIPAVYLDHGPLAGMTDRFSGIPIPVRSPEETIRRMARAFERLEGDPEWRRTLGANARARVIQHYCPESRKQRLRQTYEALLALNHPQAWHETLLR